MNVSVLIPYRPQYGEPYRTQNLEAVLMRWDWLMGQYFQGEILIGSCPGDPFNRSAARNAAFRKANEDVLILCDADTLFVENDAITWAVDEVWRGAPWVIPYGTYWNASKPWTDRYYRTVKTPPVMEIGLPGSYEHKLANTISGMIVMRREVYASVGGYDERFKGWGYEDDAFGYAVEALHGKAYRLNEYNVIHLWHPHGPETNFSQPYIDYNRALLWQYEQAAKTGTMLELIEGRE